MSGSWSGGGERTCLSPPDSFCFNILNSAMPDGTCWVITDLPYNQPATGGVKCSDNASRQKGRVERAPGLEADAIRSEPELSRLVAGCVTLGKSLCLVIVPTT